MAQLTDLQRALEPRVLGSPGGGRAIEGSLPPGEPVALREAALILGKVSLAITEQGRSLGEPALPTDRLLSGDRALDARFDLALQRVFGSEMSSVARFRRYDRCYETVIPQLQKSALAWATRTLTAQSGLLIGLLVEISDPRFKEWMHQAADQIVNDSLDLRASDARRLLQPPQTYSALSALRASENLQVLAASRQLRIRSAAAKVETSILSSGPPMVRALRDQFVGILRIFRSARAFPDIVEAYQRSADEGTNLVRQLLSTAIDAIVEFSAALAQKAAHVWRYPVMILGALKALGLLDVPGFEPFALQIANIKSRRTPEAFLSAVGVGLLVVGLVATGIGGAALILDFALGGAATYFSYVRNSEQEVATHASLFIPDQTKFASEFGYGDTVLSAAFMLVAGYSLVRGGVANQIAKQGAASANQTLPSRGVPGGLVGSPKTVEVSAGTLPPMRGSPSNLEDVSKLMSQSESELLAGISPTRPAGVPDDAARLHIDRATTLNLSPESKALEYNGVEAFATARRDKAVRFIVDNDYLIDTRLFKNPSSYTATGAPRDGEQFWKALLHDHPEMFSKRNQDLILGKIKKGQHLAPEVDPEWILYNPSHRPYKGERLVHHHVEEGPWAVGIPEPVHAKEFWKELHPIIYPDVLK